MKSCIQFILCLSFLFYASTTIWAQGSTPGDPPPGPSHVLVKGSSTRGFLPNDCSPVTEEGSTSTTEISLELAISNLETFTIGGTETFGLPLECPDMYLELLLNDFPIAISGPIRYFDFDEYHDPYEPHDDPDTDDSAGGGATVSPPGDYDPSEYQVPMYKKTVTFTLGADIFCGAPIGFPSPDGVVATDIQARITQASGESYLAAGGGCDINNLYPPVIFGVLLDEYINLTFYVCCPPPEGDFGDAGADDRNNLLEGQSPLIEQNSLLKVSPNPFQSTFQIDYQSAAASDISIQLFDAQGRTLKNWEFYQEEGSHQFSIDGSDLPKGLYFGQLQIGDCNESFRLLKQ